MLEFGINVSECIRSQNRVHQVYAVIMKSVHKMTNVTLGEDSLREFD